MRYIRQHYSDPNNSIFYSVERVTCSRKTPLKSWFRRAFFANVQEAYEEMADFAETVTDAYLLAVALRGKGAFRRFKDLLLDYPAERERWFAFEDRRRRELIEEWARDEGVGLILKGGDSPFADRQLTSSPSVRSGG